MSDADGIQQSLADAGFLDHDPANPPAMGSDDFEFASAELKGMMDLAERTVTAWIASPQDNKVAGKVVDISEVESDFQPGRMCPLLTVETPSARLIHVFCWHTVLRNEVERQIKRGQLTIGSNIVIVYQGPIQGNNRGNPTEMYRVVARPAA